MNPPGQHRFRWLRAALAAAVVLLAVAAARAGPPPARVVAIGGAVTEVVHELAQMDALVAVDSTSTYPAPARELPNVGYMRQLAAEPIIALAPDRVIAVADAGPPVVFDQLRAAGIDITRVPDEATAEGVLEKIRVVAAALAVPGRGEALADRVAERFAALRERVARTGTRPRVLTVIAAGPGNLMAAGRETSAAGIARLAGGRNAIRAYSGFRPLSAEAVIEAAPEWIVLTEAALESLGGREGVRERPALGTTPAARAGRIVALDGLLLLGFGPRTPAVAARLAAHLHDELPAAE